MFVKGNIKDRKIIEDFPFILIFVFSLFFSKKKI